MKTESKLTIESHVNPLFSGMTDFIGNIPRHDYSVDTVFCNHRNTVELVTCNGRRFVIKKYKRPTKANQIIYTYFRASKARRAYEYALRLKSMGVDTATPVAYIEGYAGGIFHTGWFVSEYIPRETLASKMTMTDVAERERLASSYVRFTCDLHNKGIYHRDYNPGNLLVSEADGCYDFALIDINSIRFGHTPGVYRSAVSFMQNDLDRKSKMKLVSRYVAVRNLSPVLCRLSCYLSVCRRAAKKSLKFPVKFVIRLMNKQLCHT